MEVAFRHTREEQSDVGAISAWLRLGEIEAEKMDCPKYSKPKFEKAVEEIRTLTVLARLQQLCREAGVVLVLVPCGWIQQRGQGKKSENFYAVTTFG